MTKVLLERQFGIKELILVSTILMARCTKKKSTTSTRLKYAELDNI